MKNSLSMHVRRKKRLIHERVHNEIPHSLMELGEGLFALHEKYALMQGDSLQRLRDLPSSFVHTCLTSPPYWKARDYEHKDQIGQEKDPQSFVDYLVGAFSEVKRVLRDDGSVWLNLGDTYLNGIGTVNGKPPEKGWKRNKQLGLIPFRVAIALQEDGWCVRNCSVWHKPNAMPESVDDRLTSTWEPVFLLTKTEDYYFNLDAVRVPHSTSDAVERRRAEQGTANGKAKGKSALRQQLTSPRHRATIDGLKEIRVRPNAPDTVELAQYLRASLDRQKLSIKYNPSQLQEPFERVRHYFRTDRIGARLPPEETWPKLKDLLKLDDTYDEAMDVVVRDNVFRNHPLGRNPGDLMRIPTARSDDDHFALMPEQLALNCLKATLPPQGICLDPFMGLGTTGRVALQLNGRFIGIDLNEKYIDKFIKWARGPQLRAE